MVFTGHASPVVLSDNELAELAQLEDFRGERFTAPDCGPAEPPQIPLDTRVARAALITVLILAAMLPVALAFALATP